MCNCIPEINKELKVHGLELELGFRMPDFAAFVPIHTIRVNPRDRKIVPKTFMPTYCPFCGEKQGEIKGEVSIGNEKGG